MDAVDISEWIKYEEYIDSEIRKYVFKEGENIKGLECLPEGNKITYVHSKFNNAISGQIKRMYEDAGIPDKQNPSFTSIFKDDRAHFVPFNNRILDLTLTVDIFEEDNTILVEDVYSGRKNEMITSSLQSEKVQKYIDYKKENFKSIIDRAEEKPTLFIDFVFNRIIGLMHALAIICFKKEGQFYLGIYDPMFYYRNEENNYTIPLIRAYTHYYLLSNSIGIDLKIMNLSSFCPKTEKGQHCLQYKINAEYCSMYCLYFIYLYAKNNYPTSEEEIKSVVEQTFIVSPLNLSREVCIKTNIFKIKMMSFMLTFCILYSQRYFHDLVDKFIEKAKILSEESGIKLVPPSVLPLEGGKRRTKRYTKKYTKKYSRKYKIHRRRTRRRMSF